MGTSDESMRIGRLLSTNPTAHFIIAGYIDDYNLSNTDKFIGRLEDICSLVKKHHVNEIIIPENEGDAPKLVAGPKKEMEETVAQEPAPVAEPLNQKKFSEPEKEKPTPRLPDEKQPGSCHGTLHLQENQSNGRVGLYRKTPEHRPENEDPRNRWIRTSQRIGQRLRVEP
mgnify:CR=1 FL=1